jgi:SpoIID/LytB domain protein
MNMSYSRIEKFVCDQLSVWPMAAENYRNLKKAETRTLPVGGLNVVLQYNPARKISSEAKLDKKSISERPCFLCPENRPREQYDIDFEGRKGKRYRITLNPYPIFPSHLVISSTDHTPQSIWHRYPDMLDFVATNRKYACYYNGPESGASAPDHMHFQGCPRGMMPLENAVDKLLGSARSHSELECLTNLKEAKLYHLNMFTRGIFVLRGATPKSVTKLFYRLADCASMTLGGEPEPKFNVISWFEDNEYRSLVIFRSKHRPHNYFSDGPDHLSMSPGCADMGGVMVAPEESDYEKMTPELLSQVISEVSIGEDDEKALVWRLTRHQQTLEVGIMSGQQISFEIISDGNGEQKVEYSEGKILYNGTLYDQLIFDAKTPSTMFAEPSFILHGVTIGVDFHWERQVTQKFAGRLKFITDGGKVTAVNEIGVEDYLLSVISSEMKSSAGLEFLKAHSVISRSWVMAQILNRKKSVAGFLPCEAPHNVAELVTMLDCKAGEGKEESHDTEYIKWFDHDDHKVFDACADDHCQRYQGLTMAVGETVRKAIDQTWGLVLKSGGEICDARFSKCCGGRMELFSTCWEDKDYPYLQALPDTPDEKPGGDPFCDATDEKILSQVLNDYDLETKDFYRWTVEYSRNEVSDLIRTRSGIDFGTIQELIPIERGPSGRIKRLRVVGSKREMIIGKELIIRKWLSSSHLKSSAFTVIWNGDKLTLKGSGWGHGVGLCQIGAAVMASKGYCFQAILGHYYPGSELLPMVDDASIC